MMILKKRYKRDMKHNLSLYVSSTLLTVLSLLLFYLYYICGTGIKDYSTEFYEKQRLEDANFSTFVEMTQDDIEDYEKEYNLELEKQEFINIETDGVTARVFDRTEKVDLYKVTEGRDVSEDDEVVISEGYARNCKIEIGDRIKIKDKKYTVTGYMERPDYLYMIENQTDAYKNITSFFICYMTDDEFDTLGEKNCQYLVRYKEDNNKEFRKDVNDRFLLSSYLESEDNIRIIMVDQQPEIFLLMAYVILFTLPLIAVLLISVILSRKIKSEQKMIGTLDSFGYTNKQLIMHYAGFSAIPGLVGGILTTIVVACTVDSYGALGLMDYEPMPVDFKLNVSHMILGITVPTIMYIISTALTVRRLLKNDITVLLAGAAKGKNKIRRFMVGKKVSFRTKFGVRSMLGNPGRTFVLFLGVFLGSFVILFSLGFYDSMKNMSNETTEQMELYQHQYILSDLMEENDYGGETMLAAAIEDESGRILSIYGADDNSLVGLKDKDGERVEVDDGYLITGLYSKIYDVHEGDNLKISNPLSMEEFEIRIDGVVDNNFVKAVYTSRENVSEITGMDEDLFNVILSKEKLNIPEKKLVSSVDRDSIDDQYDVIFDQMNVLIYIFMAVGIFLCIVSVYIAVNMTVTENRTNISMLRVLGYDDRKIRKLLLNDNIIIVVLGMIISIPFVYLVGDAMFESFVDIIGYLIILHIHPLSYVYGVLLVLASYYASVHLASRKIARVDMVESLKDNRE